MLHGCGRVTVTNGRVLRSVVAAMIVKTVVATKIHGAMRFLSIRPIFGQGRGKSMAPVTPVESDGSEEVVAGMPESVTQIGCELQPDPSVFTSKVTKVVEKVFNQTWVGALRLPFYLARRSNSTQLNWPAWKGSMQ